MGIEVLLCIVLEANFLGPEMVLEGNLLVASAS